MWLYVLITVVLFIIMYGARERIKSFPKGGHRSGLVFFLPSIIAILIIVFGSNITHPKDVKLVNHAVKEIRCYNDWDESVEGKKIHHPRKYSMICTEGDETYISKNTYQYFLNLWGGDKILSEDNKYSTTIWNHDPGTALIVSRPIAYKNYMMNVYTLYDIHDVGISNAIEYNLFIRPGVGVINNNNVLEPRQNLILGINAPDSIQRKLNYIASLDDNFRPVLLIWPNEENNKISQQRNLWTSGKANEAVFCIGLDSIGKISWSGSFSWDNTKSFETFILREVLSPGKVLDLNKYVNYVESGYKNGYWKPVTLENYDFLKVPFHEIVGFYLMGIVILVNLVVGIQLLFWSKKNKK